MFGFPKGQTNVNASARLLGCLAGHWRDIGVGVVPGEGGEDGQDNFNTKPKWSSNIMSTIV